MLRLVLGLILSGTISRYKDKDGLLPSNIAKSHSDGESQDIFDNSMLKLFEDHL